MKNLTVKIKDALTNLVAYVKGRVGYIWNRIKTGQEPIVVRGFVVALVALAAMFGQVIDPNTVWLILAFLVPAAVSARGQVEPSENKTSWLKRLKDLALGKDDEEPNIHPPQEPDDEPEVPVNDNDVEPDDGPVQPDFQGEPDWLDDFIDDLLADEADAEIPEGGN